MKLAGFSSLPQPPRNVGWGAVALAGVAALTVASHQVPSLAPELGQPNSLTQVELEISLGEMTAKQLEQETPLWYNPQAQARVQGIGAVLAQTSTRPELPYRFKILDSNAVNAFAVPGGHVYVTRALVEQFPDDQELAFILAHEVAHQEQSHSLQQLGQKLGRGMLTAPLGFRQWPLSRAVLKAGDTLVSNRYSQEAESEADRLGQLHLVRLGIDPDKAGDALQRLMLSGQTPPSPGLEQIFSDHPPSSKRIQNLRHWADQMQSDLN